MNAKTFFCDALAASLTPEQCQENRAAGNIVPCLSCLPGNCTVCGRWQALNAARRCGVCRSMAPETPPQPPFRADPRAAGIHLCPHCGHHI